MPVVSVHGTRIHVDDSGPGSTGESVVFSHGLLMNSAMFAPQIASLRGRYRTIAWDHRGQGRSDVDARRAIGMEIVTDDALALLDALETGPVHFVGLSMGGFVGMRLAARWPERVRSLTLLNTSADPEPRGNLPKYAVLNALAGTFGVGPIVDRVMPILFGATTMTSPAREALRAKWRSHLESNGKTITRAVRGVLEREGVAHLLAKIAVPTLVVSGAEDVATLPEKGEAIARAIPGARFEVVAGAGHSSSVEAPEAVTALLEQHLARG